MEVKSLSVCALLYAPMCPIFGGELEKILSLAICWAPPHTFMQRKESGGSSELMLTEQYKNDYTKTWNVEVIICQQCTNEVIKLPDIKQ